MLKSAGKKDSIESKLNWPKIMRNSASVKFWKKKFNCWLERKMEITTRKEPSMETMASSSNKCSCKNDNSNWTSN